MSQNTPNYVNPTSRAPVMLGVSVLFLFLASVFVGSRVFIRIRLGRTGADEVLIVIAWALVLGIVVCLCVSIRYGLGRHSWDIPPENYIPLGKIVYTYIILYNPVLIFYKSSILVFYLRLAPHPFTTFRKICYITGVYILVTSSVFFLINIFGCRPISGAWTGAPGTSCVNKHTLYLVSGANNIGTDMLLLLLPIPIVMKLRMRMRIKLGIVTMFSMGFLVTVVSAIRLYHIDIAMRNKDNSWDGAYSSMWSVIELSVGVMTACMPAAKQVVAWLWPGSMGVEEEVLAGRVEGDIEVTVMGNGGEERGEDVYPELRMSARDGSEECIVKEALG